MTVAGCPMQILARGASYERTCALALILKRTFTQIPLFRVGNMVVRHDAAGFEFDNSHPTLSLDGEIKVSRGFRGVYGIGVGSRPPC